MHGQLIIQIVGYITAAIVMLAGILVLTGYIVSSYVPENFRIVAGIVLILYGIYRPAMIFIKNKNAKRFEE
jgi:putative Mn2+ efflux pump MntP